jgi:hypothetical protein
MKVLFFKAIDFYNKDDQQRPDVQLIMLNPQPVYKGELPTPNNNWNLPELMNGQNAEVPSISSAASVKHNKNLGRHLVANRNIETGNLSILVEPLKYGFASVAIIK